MSAISRTAGGRDAKSLVANAAGLASLPEVVARVIALADDPNSTASQFDSVISRDPNLAARLLRIANSPYYSLTGEIDTIARAVTVVGTRHIRDLTLGVAAIRTFSGIPMELVSMEDFWVHSLYCAHLSRWLAAGVPRMEDTVFVGGLLHDIGQLLLFIQLPDESREALWMVSEGPDDLSMDAAERQVLGFDHTEVGAELARQWHLPQALLECIAWHHQPGRASPGHAREAAIVHVANSVAYLAETDSTDLFAGPPILESAARLAMFDERDLPRMVAESRAEMAILRGAFGV
jgi:putative nucleotidyltransferase with HDIG domain